MAAAVAVDVARAPPGLVPESKTFCAHANYVFITVILRDMLCETYICI